MATVLESVRKRMRPPLGELPRFQTAFGSVSFSRSGSRKNSPSFSANQGRPSTSSRGSGGPIQVVSARVTAARRKRKPNQCLLRKQALRLIQLLLGKPPPAHLERKRMPQHLIHHQHHHVAHPDPVRTVRRSDIQPRPLVVEQRQS